MNYETAMGHLEEIEHARDGWEASVSALRSLRNASINEGLDGIEAAMDDRTYGGLSPRDCLLRELERIRSALAIRFSAEWPRDN